MAYLGRAVDSGAISNIQNLDNITFDGSSSYSLTKNSVAFVPSSASNLLISIDGVVNATNFTVNNSTIDFGVTVPSSSVCNFIIHLGVGIVTAPSDGSVTTAKLGDGSVTTAKITDANVTSAKMFSGFKNGITEADQWRWTANFTGNAQPITSNWERNDTSFDKIGTGMSESSGIFTFPSTGIYQVDSFTHMYLNSNSRYNEIVIRLSTNGGSNYSTISYSYTSISRNTGLTTYGFVATKAIIDVTNTSNFKVAISVSHHDTNTIVAGDTDNNRNATTFIRLGDT